MLSFSGRLSRVAPIAVTAVTRLASSSCLRIELPSLATLIRAIVDASRISLRSKFSGSALFVLDGHSARAIYSIHAMVGRNPQRER